MVLDGKEIFNSFLLEHIDVLSLLLLFNVFSQL